MLAPRSSLRPGHYHIYSMPRPRTSFLTMRHLPGCLRASYLSRAQAGNILSPNCSFPRPSSPTDMVTCLSSLVRLTRYRVLSKQRECMYGPWPWSRFAPAGRYCGCGVHACCRSRTPRPCIAAFTFEFKKGRISVVPGTMICMCADPCTSCPTLLNVWLCHRDTMLECWACFSPAWTTLQLTTENGGDAV
ncbi:hypothetical protein EXIGLDRAFT_454462 [Exidia glandulosa HHB12029]|uniref:Uncharacterized protein n=1 Tax=Exidia glandulosa HHB12029 TaxID=1314781 RepID=A0A165B1V9_EXIGL|nr:hypothetical protein EXIGLDRAFT_454462 [Exidia glandulosa HHB12029]